MNKDTHVVGNQLKPFRNTVFSFIGLQYK